MNRKLAAILSADVVGYSALMEADEQGTLERLKTNRATIFEPTVSQNSGRVFKVAGDGAMVEFPSAIAAVTCALQIQTATEKAAANQKDETPLRYRIGINLGEVIVENDDLYGDGVNIAARIQALAPVGGIALARNIKEQVEGKIACVYEDMGEHLVKNIERPLHVYSTRTNEFIGSIVRPNLRQHGPSICVLPFTNMSDDPQQEYFSDGIAEDIIIDLTKISALSVVARNTAFTFKKRALEVPQIARHLGVSHVLQGSVRKSG